MYAGVHSSVSPQQSHMANSTSIWAMSLVAAAGCVSGADITIGSLIIVADMANNPATNIQSVFQIQNKLVVFLFSLLDVRQVRKQRKKEEEAKDSTFLMFALISQK